MTTILVPNSITIICIGLLLAGLVYIIKRRNRDDTDGDQGSNSADELEEHDNWGV